jgi:hypothetical protein
MIVAIIGAIVVLLAYHAIAGREQHRALSEASNNSMADAGETIADCLITLPVR